MNRIFLTFLVILLASSIAESSLDEKTKQTVNIICQQTTDVKFCSSVFLNNMVSSSPSSKELMNMTLGVAERFSANTNFFIGTLLRNAGNEREGLKMCADAYAVVNGALENAVAYFVQGFYSKIFRVEVKVVLAVEICNTDFDVPGYKVNPFIEKNRDTRILMTILKIIGQMVSS